MPVVSGMLAPSLLVAVPGDEYGNVLPILAASSWVRLCDDVEARFGWRPALSGGGCGYRTYTVQERIFRERYVVGTGSLSRAHLATLTRGNGGIKSWLGQTWYRLPGKVTAAVPGTSNHGYDKGAVDVGGLGGFSGRKFGQFATVAVEHGWTNTEGAGINEAWHWVRDGFDQHLPTTAPPAHATTEDEDMTPEQMDALLNGVTERVLAILRAPEFQMEQSKREAPTAEAVWSKEVNGVQAQTLLAAINTNVGYVLDELKKPRDA